MISSCAAEYTDTLFLRIVRSLSADAARKLRIILFCYQAVSAADLLFLQPSTAVARNASRGWEPRWHGRADRELPEGPGGRFARAAADLQKQRFEWVGIRSGKCSSFTLVQSKVVQSILKDAASCCTV